MYERIYKEDLDMQMIIAKKNPYPLDPLAFIVLIPMLIVYWCPTSAYIYILFTEGFEWGLFGVTCWGIIATIILMSAVLCIIRDIAWKIKEKEKK